MTSILEKMLENCSKEGNDVRRRRMEKMPM